MSFACIHCGVDRDSWVDMRFHYVDQHPDLRHPARFKTKNAIEDGDDETAWAEFFAG